MSVPGLNEENEDYMLMNVKLAHSWFPVHGLYVSNSSPIPLQHLVQCCVYRINDPWWSWIKNCPFWAMDLALTS